LNNIETSWRQEILAYNLGHLVILSIDSDSETDSDYQISVEEPVEDLKFDVSSKRMSFYGKIKDTPKSRRKMSFLMGST